LLDTRGDTDQDYVLDGIECVFRSRPDQSIRSATAVGQDCLSADYPSAGNCATRALNCRQAVSITAGETDDEGCAQPGLAGHAGTNPDGIGSQTDGLYLPGGNTTTNTRIEHQFRVGVFNQANGTALNDIDADEVVPLCGPRGVGECDRDSDEDVLGQANGGVNIQDGTEVWSYGTFPADSDTDQDGCPDADETNDVNGDGTTNSGDQGLFASRVGQLGSNLDNNLDGRVDDYTLGVNVDINKSDLYQIASGDQGLMGATIVAPGSCTLGGTAVEDNVDITPLLNLP
jgi:hypothetical protein